MNRSNHTPSLEKTSIVKIQGKENLSDPSENSRESPSRHFTHITIPAEIWLRTDISLQAKCLWAEIRSLHDQKRGGCFASNEYLQKFIGVKDRFLRSLFGELKKAGLLETVSSNGRSVLRRAIVPKVVYTENVENVYNVQNAGLTGSELPPSKARYCRSPIYIENKEENKETTKESASAPSSVAAALLTDFFSSLFKAIPNFPKAKAKKTKSQLKSAESLLKQYSPEEIKSVISYAHSSTFWKPHVHTMTYLEEKFITLKLQMENPSKKDNGSIDRTPEGFKPSGRF